jgi:hypothetical protein
MNRIAVLGIVFASLALPGCFLFCIACDGALGMDGHVYEWTGAPPGAASAARIDVDPSTADGLVPLQGAEIVLEPWTRETRPTNPETARLWTRHASSDVAGAFTISGTAKPGWYDVTLAVQRQGFRPVEHVFRHDRFRHRVIVLLVRDGTAPQ